MGINQGGFGELIAGCIVLWWYKGKDSIEKEEEMHNLRDGEDRQHRSLDLKIRKKNRYFRRILLTIPLCICCCCCCCCCCLGMASRWASGYFTLNGDKIPPAASDSGEVARSLKQRCYPHIGNGGHTWRLSISLSLSVGFTIQDVARSAPQGAHFYHADVIYLLL